MHRYHVLLFSLAVLGGLPTMALAMPRPIAVPPDSFLDQHVSSMSQLSRQVTLDPVVRRRLARHFHISGPALVRYIQTNLILKKTTTAQSRQVYCISRTGLEYTINSRLRVGTPVFVMRATGKPILKLACGNPMVAQLPPVRTKFMPYTSPEMASLPKPVPAALAPELAPELAPNSLVVVTVSGKALIVMPPRSLSSPEGFTNCPPTAAGFLWAFSPVSRSSPGSPITAVIPLRRSLP